jgi:hypothetical protein
METLRTLFVLALLAVGARADFGFDSMLAHPQLWSLDQDAFQKATPGLPFQWTSNARDSARAASRKGMTLFGRPIYEVIARFEGNKLTHGVPATNSSG